MKKISSWFEIATLEKSIKLFQRSDLELTEEYTRLKSGSMANMSL